MFSSKSICSQYFVLFTILFSYFGNNLFGQNQKIDSLQCILDTKYVYADSFRLNVMTDLCWEYVITNPIAIKNYEKELLAIEKFVHKDRVNPKVHVVLAAYYREIKNSAEAFNQYNIALNYYKSVKDTLNIIRSFYRLGELRNSTYDASKKDSLNKHYYFEALRYLEKFKDPERLILIQNGLAIVYIMEKKYYVALSYLEKSQAIYDSIDFPSKNRSLGYFYLHKAKCFYFLNKLEKAKPYLDQAEAIASELNYLNLKVSVNHYLGLYYQSIGKLEVAEKYLLKNTEIQKNVGLINHFTTIEDLMIFYQQTNNKNKAFGLLKNYLMLKDSVTKVNNDNLYAELETQFKVRQKDSDIKLLESGKEIDQNKIIIRNILLLASTILLIFILYLLYWKRKQADLLQKSNEYKGQLLNVMGHDIRTPLVTQLSIMQDIFERKLEFSSTQMSTIYNLSLSVFKISDNVYNWVKQSGRSAVNFNDITTFNYEFLLILEQYLPVLNMKNLHIKHNVEMDKVITIKGDRIGVQSVIRNLIDNSVKYCPVEDSISIMVRVQDNVMLFEIKNQCDKVIYQNKFSKNYGLGLRLIEDILTYNQGKLVKNEIEGDTYHVIISFTLA